MIISYVNTFFTWHLATEIWTALLQFFTRRPATLFLIFSDRNNREFRIFRFYMIFLKEKNHGLGILAVDYTNLFNWRISQSRAEMATITRRTSHPADFSQIWWPDPAELRITIPQIAAFADLSKLAHFAVSRGNGDHYSHYAFLDFDTANQHSTEIAALETQAAPATARPGNQDYI